ncbi:MAG: sulfur relay protein DsrC [Thiohalophilus sp.]
MLWLSEVLLQNHDLESFEQLEKVIVEKAREGEMFFRMDVKPPFQDTPANWEERLEAVFTSRTS